MNRRHFISFAALSVSPLVKAMPAASVPRSPERPILVLGIGGAGCAVLREFERSYAGERGDILVFVDRERSRDGMGQQLEQLMENSAGLVAIAGLGGSGFLSSSVMARSAALSRAQGKPSIAVLSRPFFFEGDRRARQADLALGGLRRSFDAVLETDANIVFQGLGDRWITLEKAFRLLDMVQANRVESARFLL